MTYLRYLPHLAFFYLVWRVWDYPYFIYTEPPLWVALGGLAALLYWGRRVPVAGWLWWGWGLLTLAWSLAPGNTLVAGLWELPILAALAVGRWRWGLVALNLYLLLVGLFTTLSLFHYGLVQYFSGSAHYLLGEQALWLVPLAFYWMLTKPRFRWAAGLLAVLSVYAVLMSGARAAYLPLALLLPALVVFAAREGVRPLRSLGYVALVFLLVAGIDAAAPGHPVQTALLYKSEVTRRDAGNLDEGIGNIGSRITMWKLAVHMVALRPLGTGNGSYAQVFEGFMDVPEFDGVWSRSPHNYLLETLATGGWPRFFLLLVLLWPIVRGFFSDDWPWALAAAALWTTLLFDVTGFIPGFLILAFMTLGPLLPEAKPAPSWVWGLGLAAGVALAAWWYSPCTGPECAIERYRGFPGRVRAALKAYPDRANALLVQVEKLYPESPWPLLVRIRSATSSNEKEITLRRLVEKFPYANANYYRALIRMYLESGNTEMARSWLRIARLHFPRSAFVDVTKPPGFSEP